MSANYFVLVLAKPFPFPVSALFGLSFSLQLSFSLSPRITVHITLSFPITFDCIERTLNVHLIFLTKRQTYRFNNCVTMERRD